MLLTSLDFDWSNRIASYRCQCQEGFEGTNCNVRIRNRTCNDTDHCQPAEPLASVSVGTSSFTTFKPGITTSRNRLDRPRFQSVNFFKNMNRWVHDTMPKWRALPASQPVQMSFRFCGSPMPVGGACLFTSLSEWRPLQSP